MLILSILVPVLWGLLILLLPVFRNRKALLIATGADKADAVLTLVKGAINPNLPASALRMHPNAIIVLDEDAASKL